MARPPAFNEAPLPLFEGEEAVRAVNSDRLPSYIKGHRKRLRERFLQRGSEALADYELLELLLFRTFKNGDVKPLANRLMQRFGNLDRVISAPRALLQDVDGVGPEAATDFKVLEALARRMARAQVMHRPVLSGWDALLDYCHTAMAHRATEQFRVLYLDRKNVLIADEEQAEGTVDHVPVYPREVVKRALELNASALILVHNHPSGDPTPSDSDIQMTIQIEDAARVLGVTLHDHLIIGKETELSMRSAGYL
ncbi:DNA repair protein RadC [Candidatus Rhodobacter oscarellae]|uniref:DNA repair protein RadC n=1 Tax=Candidatus Rhodobacter oscarellae TaxID=1675527 RepID=A0A0J9EBA6_9RHOB|nr:DNA repair protein RadC [Candidatus Rhodobacter lobularis]KMW58974.1 DNA repair protein RadC [Candidatus Rhodobacter lobularis]